MEIALIGCGASGSAIAIQLAKSELRTIKLVDIDLNRSNKLLNILHSINSELVVDEFRIDTTKTKEIKKILSNVNVVINAASPTCNVPVMKACLNSDTNYIDLASDPFRYSGVMKGTTLDEQLELNEKFIKNDLVAVTNAGFSPGFTDVLCKHVVEDNNLDFLEEVKIYLGEKIESKKLVVSWSPYMLLLESISPPTVFHNGKIIEIGSQKSLRDFKFPEPLGKIEVKTANGHPELRTIPEFIDVPVKHVEVAGGTVLNKLELNDLIVEALSKKAKESVIFNGDIIEILSSVFENPDEFTENYKKGLIKKENVCSVIEIKGKKNKRMLNYRAVIQHSIEETIKKIPTASVSTFLVSFTPAIIAREIISGKIEERGVVAPASLNIASEIIKECKETGLNIKESFEWQ
ncbi:MAG: saccharopine dehydrogenase family protein [Candidatus Aenigmatarchaeota archaeon]